MHEIKNNSTGPRTAEGKSKSARNSIKSGLFTAADFVLDNELDEYTNVLTALWTHIKPQNVFEELHVTEMMTASWRLRRCRIMESALPARLLTPEELAKEQKPIDRARSQAHGVLRRCTAELRRSQTESEIRLELKERDFDISDYPGLADSRQILSTIRAWDKHVDTEAKARTDKDDEADKLTAALSKADEALGMKTPFDSSFCNPTLTTAGIR